MAMREELESAGSVLFRGRSYYPLVMLAGVALVNRSASTPFGSTEAGWFLCCLAVGLFGVAIRCITVGHVAGGTSGRGVRAPKAATLNTSGMYSLVHHPLYLGNYFMWLGPALLPASAAVVAIVTLSFWLYYERIAMAEEAYLRAQFGGTFESWASRTPAFLPRDWKWSTPERSFNLRVVLRREHWGVIGLLLTMVTLQVVHDARLPGAFVLDPIWATMGLSALGAATVIFVFKRVQKAVRALRPAPRLT